MHVDSRNPYGAEIGRASTAARMRGWLEWVAAFVVGAAALLLLLQFAAVILQLRD